MSHEAFKKTAALLTQLSLALDCDDEFPRHDAVKAAEGELAEQERRIKGLETELAEAKADAANLEHDCRKMRLYIDECLDHDAVLGPDCGEPNKEDERYWSERGWSYDGFGTWAPPGYHIVRPGEVQENEYRWYSEHED